MNRTHQADWLEDEWEECADRHAMARQQTKDRRLRALRRGDYAALDEKAQYGKLPAAAAGSVFAPTLRSSHYEREWILEALGPYYDGKMITDVLRQVRGGKEATVYCCAAHPGTGLEFIAAKIYRPRMFRNLRNDALYRQSRPILDDHGTALRDDRLLRAIRHGTRVGQEALHVSWMEHEFQTLRRLYAAGVSVPQPLACGDNAILMEYIGEPGTPAPTLNQVTLDRETAQALLERLLQEVERMLASDRVHGDLSAYNVLYWKGDYKLIDFPQAVDPWTHPEAQPIFQRDVARLCQYFARYGIVHPAEELAAELWARFNLPPRRVWGEAP